MEQPTRRRLTKGHDRMIGGVASGLAEYFDLDPTLARGGIVVLGLVMPPLAVLGYLLFAVILPPPSERAPGAQEPGAAPVRNGGIALLVLLAVAVFLFSGTMWSGMWGWGMPHMWNSWFWPGRLIVPALIVAGVLLLLSRGRTR